MPRDRWPWFAFDPRWRLWSIRRYILHYIALYCIAWHPYANDDRYGVTFCILHCIALYLIRRKAMINMALYLPFPPTLCTIRGYAQGNVYWEWLYNCSFWQWQWHWPLVALPNLLFQVSRGTWLPVSHKYICNLMPLAPNLAFMPFLLDGKPSHFFLIPY